MLAGGGIGIRARLDGEQSLVLSGNHLKSPPQRDDQPSAIASQDSASHECPYARIDGALDRY